MLIAADDRAALRRISLPAGWCVQGAGGVPGSGGCAQRCVLRTREGVRWLRPRRGRYREAGCGAPHVLLPDVCLLRRRDAVRVIGEAMLAAAGMGVSTDR